jgi:hypothetical protein
VKRFTKVPKKARLHIKSHVPGQEPAFASKEFSHFLGEENISLGLIMFQNRIALSIVDNFIPRFTDMNMPTVTEKT